MRDESEGLSSRNGAFRYRWIVWGVMVLAYMIVFFHRLAAGVVRDDLVRAFSLSATSFGNMASMYLYAYMIMKIPVGMLADSLGARLTVTAGMIVAGAGSFLFAFAPTASLLLVGRFLVGVGVSTTARAGKHERESHEQAQARESEWLEIGLGAQILKDLGVTSIRLLASRERHYVGLEGFGIRISGTEIV